MTLKNVVRGLPFWLALCVIAGVQIAPCAQNPVITVRFANPQNNCVTEEYCLDVEARADIPDQEVFGINLRFFYDDDILELVDFTDFQGGYGPVAPNPPLITTSIPAGPALFNFEGPAEFINGAIQLVSTGPPPIILDTLEWSKLFQICFLVEDLTANLDTFCPPLVWDLEQDPANGGFLAGDDGVVITVVDPDPNIESHPADEMVVHFNWEYIGNGMPPYGQPIDSVCSNINCALPLTFLSFEGTVGETGNILEWKTTHESDLLGFEVQHSSDRLSWKKLDFITSQGSAILTNHYYFVDQVPSQGVNYYRLEILDQDGASSYSNLVSIHNQIQLAARQLTVQPNPSREGHLSIFLTGDDVSGTPIRLLNPLGLLIREETLTQSGMELDISEVPSGVYFVLVGTAQGNLITKVIIE